MIESVTVDANNDLQEDLKNFKSDTIENYKSFVPVEVQSHSYDMVGLVCNVEHPQYLV